MRLTTFLFALTGNSVWRILSHWESLCSLHQHFSSVFSCGGGGGALTGQKGGGNCPSEQPKLSQHWQEGLLTRQPLHVRSPPPESRATCIPWAGHAFSKTARRGARRGKRPQESCAHQQTRGDMEAGRRESQREKQQHKEIEETREKSWRELDKKHISERCPAKRLFI